MSVDELIDEAVSRATDEIKSRNPDLSDEEIEPMAEEIGIGAVRFFIAKLSPEKHLTFQWDQALPRSKRPEASVRIPRRREVVRTLTESNMADSKTII